MGLVFTNVSANERHYYFQSTGRSFFAFRPTCGCGKEWQVEELDQEQVHGSKTLRKFRSVSDTKDLQGYIIALNRYVEKEENP